MFNIVYVTETTKYIIGSWKILLLIPMYHSLIHTVTFIYTLYGTCSYAVLL